jgi:hypothetical protein
VQVRTADDKRDLAAFYELLIKGKRKHGLPPQPYRFFENLWSMLKSSGKVLLLLAEVHGRPVCALVCLGFKDVLTAAYIGTDYRYMQYRPAKLIYWSAIEWGCRNRYAHFDFLRSSVGDENLRWFKRSFGAAEVPMTYYYHPHRGSVPDEGGSVKLRVLHAVLRRLPASLLEWAGAVLYRHLG